MSENVNQPTLSPEDLMTEKILAVMPGDYAYIGAGSYIAAEIELAFGSKIAMQAELDANLTMAGELAEKPQKVESKSTGLKTRNYLIPGKRETTIEVTLVGLGVKQKDWLESAEFSGTEHTIVCVSRELDRAVIFNGLRWIAQWSGESDGLFSLVLSTEITQASSQVVMLSEIPAMWPGDIVGGALFIDCYSANNVYDAEEEKFSTVASLAEEDARIGLTTIWAYKSVNNAFEMKSAGFASLYSELFLKHLIMVVSPNNLDMGDMVMMASSGDSALGLRFSGDQAQVIDTEGLVIGGTIGDTIGAMSLIEINTETSPYMLVNGASLQATKEAGFGNVELDGIFGPQGDSYVGEIYGLFAAVRELTSNERTAVVTWMKKRYGITGW